MMKIKLLCLFSLFCLNTLFAVKTASYGKWASPVSAEKIAEGSTHIVNMKVDKEMIYYNELRPNNRGRYTLVRCDAAGMCEDMTDPEFDVRTFVHEYGGAAFTVDEGIIYASNGSDGAIYRLEKGKKPRKLTDGQVRFADMQVTPQGLVAVGEEHTNGQIRNFLALIDINSGKISKLSTDHDFYSSVAFDKKTNKLAWIAWNHPNMSWTASELWMANLKKGKLVNECCIAGNGDKAEAIFQPVWGGSAHCGCVDCKCARALYFVSDRETGWWNLYRYSEGAIQPLCPLEAEVAEPMWTFGLSNYALLGNALLFSYNCNGTSALGLLDLSTGRLQRLNRSSCYIHQIYASLINGRWIASFLERYPDQGEALIQLELGARSETGYAPKFKVLRQEPTYLDKKFISKPTHICFPSSCNRTAYGFYYPPFNEDFKAPNTEKPPLVVMIHGGPTSQAFGDYSIERQFWTSRGFALLDVNYGGSSGYGRAYRSLLDGKWGVVDVEDCENGARYLIEQGWVDPEKVVIRGGSAGGYTTLAALAFKKSFKAGASYYGICDFELLQTDTHKFESQYLYQLLGQDPAVWRVRSPLNAVECIEAPLILFQGTEDCVVPKNQAEEIYKALKKRNVKVELHLYPGEQHGFRRAENIVHSLNREVEFYLEAFENKK